jgi:hypothetical protein
MSWDKSATDPIQWASKMKDAPRNAVNIFAFEVFNRVVMRTPVDTGAARQNWLVTINSETSDFNAEKTGGNVSTEGTAVINGANGDDTIFIQNNAPYIRKLEYGGYPENPKKSGATNKGEPKTVGGYSRQAPNGMVGLTLAKADQLWKRAVKAAKENT